MSRPDPAIAVTALVKEFRTARRRLRALDGVDLEVGRGEVFGLLGANGAGKTTLVKILLGLARPTSGAVRVRGCDPRRAAARARVGYLPEGHRFPGYLRADAALRLFGRLAGLPEGALDRRIPELLELVGLADRGHDRVGRYSKGMTQRLGLACALLDEPEVLFLDEPTDGVDPVGRRHIRDILLATRGEGTTIFINSHLLSEVERTCDRVAILHHGRVVRQGSVDDLTHPTQRFSVRLGGGEFPPDARLRELGAAVASRNGSYELDVPDLETLNRVVDLLRAERLLIAEVSPVRAALEDVFVAAVEAEEREPAPGPAVHAVGGAP
ncbi:MAG TPA: ABC transporter ATP-binding protein [Thermoanaerobaculaceae bacterium]|nr:ABC transporter ATP-binding protein [Thermoanaerobaculaceae bacterium]